MSSNLPEFIMSSTAYNLLSHRLGIKQVEKTRALLSLGETGEDDFHDNFPHETAKMEASLATVEVDDLEYILRNASIIPPRRATDQVGVGNTVEILYAGDEEPTLVTILGYADALAHIPGHISHHSALGQALLGSISGSTVSFSVHSKEENKDYPSKVTVLTILPGQFYFPNPSR